MKSIKITKASMKESYDNLVLRSRLDIDFVLLTIFSATICSFGFRMNSASVIIGAMVIAPLLYAVVTMGASSFKKDGKAFYQGVKTLLAGVALVVIVTTIINLLFPIVAHSEIIDRINGSALDYFFIAFFSGLAGTFAFFWPDIIEAIAGISIAVALVPPTVLVGIGLANADQHLFLLSSLIVAMNLLGIYLGSLCMFAGLEFLSRHR